MTAPPRMFRPPPSHPVIDTANEEEPRFSLSLTQVLASMTAAVIAAFLGSRLGVAGTVTGAALASVISVVGGAVFGHSILMTRKKVKSAVLTVRGPRDTDDDRTVVIPAVREPRRPQPTRRRIGMGLLVGLAATLAIFLSSLAAVTLVETVKGSPLSGGDSGGLSVLGGNSGTDTNPARVPTDSTTPGPTTTGPTTPGATTRDSPTTVVTRLSTVTQTVTSAQTQSTEPTADPTRTTAATSAAAANPTSSARAPDSSAGGLAN